MYTPIQIYTSRMSRFFSGNIRGHPAARPTSLFPPSFCDTPPSSQKSSSSTSASSNEMGSDGIGNSHSAAAQLRLLSKSKSAHHILHNNSSCSSSDVYAEVVDTLVRPGQMLHNSTMHDRQANLF